MRSLTTDWNNASYALAATFLDKKSGTYVTIPADEPTKARSMADSVNGGDYAEFAADAVPATAVADSVSDAEAVGTLLTTEVEVTVAGSAADSVGVRVTATSADPDVVSVSPAKALTDGDGKVVFTITGEADGAEDVTFAVASDPTVEAVVTVTVTDPTLGSDAVEDAIAVVIGTPVVVECEVLDDATPRAGVTITAVSETPAEATVTPASAVTDENGLAEFTVTGLTTGTPEITFTLQPAALSHIELVVTATVTEA